MVREYLKGRRCGACKEYFCGEKSVFCLSFSGQCHLAKDGKCAVFCMHLRIISQTEF